MKMLLNNSIITLKSLFTVCLCIPLFKTCHFCDRKWRFLKQFWDKFGISIHTGSCTKITFFWEETMINVVHGSTYQKISSAVTMSNPAHLLDNYIYTGKQHRIRAKHKPACIWCQWDHKVWQSQRKWKNPVRIKKHIKLSHLFIIFIL